MKPRDCSTTQRRTLRPMHDYGGDAPVPACLVVLQGPRLGQRIEIGSEPLVIGRAPECDFQLPERSISRQHARVWLAPDGYRVKDLDSTNRTLLNEQPIIEAELKDGDHLTIGTCVLKFMERPSVEARYHEELYQLATVDPLTGLHNRRHFLELIERELSRSGARQRPLALLIADLDHFKSVNDLHGHVAGDAVLREVAHLLRAEACDDCIVARIGGEEFAIAMAECDLATAQAFAANLCRRVAALELGVDAGVRHVTISIGVAAWGGAMLTISDLLRAADAQLYRAKAAGRNRVGAPP